MPDEPRIPETGPEHLAHSLARAVIGPLTERLSLRRNQWLRYIDGFTLIEAGNIKGKRIDIPVPPGQLTDGRVDINVDTMARYLHTSLRTQPVDTLLLRLWVCYSCGTERFVKLADTMLSKRWLDSVAGPQTPTYFLNEETDRMVLMDAQCSAWCTMCQKPVLLSGTLLHELQVWWDMHEDRHCDDCTKDAPAKQLPPQLTARLLRELRNRLRAHGG